MQRSNYFFAAQTHTLKQTWMEVRQQERSSSSTVCFTVLDEGNKMIIYVSNLTTFVASADFRGCSISIENRLEPETEPQ